MKIAVTIEDDTAGADYLASLRRGGFSPEEIVVLHSRDAAPVSFDGLLLGGGEDVDPELYGAVRHDRLGRVNRRRDEQELGLITRARRSGIPIFGICRGIQVLNVAFGGSLVQDIPSDRPSPVGHSVKSPRDAPAHTVRGEPGSFLSALGEFSVNSRHHQAVDRAGAGLKVSARSPDGLVEAVEYQDRHAAIVAVQWHPENLADDAAANGLFRTFRDSVEKTAKR
jgi:putative glutamine amidotransferase